jgi:4-hydroxy-tetrahydrodipicolinate reductase
MKKSAATKMSSKKSAKISVLLSGATGKMGRLLAAALEASDDFALSFAASRASEISSAALKGIGLCIDFSVPENTLELVEKLKASSCALLIGTTGFDPAQMKSLEKSVGAQRAWALVANTSLGVYLTKKTIELWASLLPSDYKIFIEDIHHSKKRDAPSGTAKMLAKAWADGGRKDTETFSLRGGSEVGEHRIVVLGPGERLEIKHQATDRALFATGALRLGQKLTIKKARSQPYSLDELFE